MTNAVAIAQYGSTSPNKNRIINGAMVIDQRNAGASISANDGKFGVDRFLWNMQTDGTGTSQQVSTAPAGFTYSLKYTSTAATTINASDTYGVIQNIEGYNIADLGWGGTSPKNVTLSFWVYSSLTGTFSGTIKNSPTTYTYAYTYTINSANTWEYKTVTITGPTVGTWLTTNGNGMRVCFSLAAGSSASISPNTWTSGNYWGATGAVQVPATNGATWYVTGVQLEAGTTASPFEYRQYGTELQLCMRYFYLSDATAGYAYYGSGYQTGSALGSAYYYYPVPMRTTPTITSNGTWSVINGTGPLLIADVKGYNVYVIVTSTGSYSIRGGGSGYLTFNAEL